MPFNQKGVAHIFAVLILLVGIAIAVYLIQFTQVFKPKASNEPQPGGISVKSFGAVGDGVVDDTEAIQKAIDGASISNPVLIDGGEGVTYLIKGSLRLKLDTTLIGDGAKLKRGSAENIPLVTATSAVNNVTLDGIILDQDNSLSGMLLVFPNGSSNITIKNSHFINTTNVPVIDFLNGNQKNSTITIKDSSIERTIGKQQFENSYSLDIKNGENVLIENNIFSKCGSIRILALSAQANTAESPSKSIVITNNTFTGIQSTNLFVTGNANEQTFIEDVTISKNKFIEGGKWVEKGAIHLFPGKGGWIKNVKIIDNEIKDLGYKGSSEGFSDRNDAQMISLIGRNLDKNDLMENVTISGNVMDNLSKDRSAYGILVQRTLKIVNWRITNNKIQNFPYSIVVKSAEQKDVVIENNETPEESRQRDNKVKQNVEEVKKALNDYKAKHGDYCLGVPDCAVSIYVNCNCYSAGVVDSAVKNLKQYMSQQNRFSPDIGVRIYDKNTFWLFAKLENPPTSTCPVIGAAGKWYFDPSVNYCTGNIKF